MKDAITVRAADGAEIAVERHSRPGAPRLVLSHGNGFAIGGYRKFWELLALDFELCLFDLRNHGRNPLHRLEFHSLKAMASDHAAVQRAIASSFGPRRTLGLFHSISSIAAIRAAQEHALAWDQLILVDPPLIAPPGNPLRDMNEKLDAMLAAFACKRPSHFASVDELVQQYRQRLGRSWVEGADFDMAEATTRPAPDGGFELSCPGEFEARIYADNSAYDSYEAMSALRQPTFLICADPETPRALAPAFSGPQAAAKFGFTSVSVPGTGHLLQIEKPEIAAAHVREFIAATS